MDPDAALTELRTLAQQLQTILGGGHGSLLDAAAFELVDGFTGLDEWLTRGGFYPNDWSGQRAGTYSGYANRETWAVHLWLTNNQLLYDLSHIIVDACADERKAAHVLKDWVEQDLWPQLYKTHDGRNMQNDIGSLWRVEWPEVARALRGD